jgi:membrane-bound lytic murein transglycosylase MltF
MLENWAKQTSILCLSLLLLFLDCGKGSQDHRPRRADQEKSPKEAARQAVDREPAASARPPYDPSTFPLATHLKEKHTDDLAGILERRRIRVLTTFNKTNFFLADSRLYGFEYSLLREYDRSLNQGISRRELQVVMEFIPVPRDQLIPRLVAGLGDIAAAGLTITPERRKQVAFTEPYLTHVDEIVVTNRNTQDLRSLEDLSGTNVFVWESSSYFESLVELNRTFSEKGIPPVHIHKVDESLETEEILEMVNAGGIPTTIADSILAEIWSGVFPNLRICWNLKVRTGSEIAWMVRKNNPALKDSLDSFLRRHRKGTRLGNIYFRRYFENNRWIKNPLTQQALKRQRQHTELFKKYAAQYGFDWMLIMAQAYQESRLHNGKTSSAGAVGIMQVLPSTAADRNVNIRNVRLLENNVHAGVKYLAFLRDRYFRHDGIDERDRIRFSLAAYNAGPKKIRQAQRLAEEMNLDRHRWFRNVEIATLRSVGQEPVQYVSNINKYYVLFKLREETERLRQAIKHGSLARLNPG